MRFSPALKVPAGNSTRQSPPDTTVTCLPFTWTWALASGRASERTSGAAACSAVRLSLRRHQRRQFFGGGSANNAPSVQAASSNSGSKTPAATASIELSTSCISRWMLRLFSSRCLVQLPYFALSSSSMACFGLGNRCMAVALIQASTGVPPTAQPTIPTGTPVSWKTSRAKNHATAEHSPTDCGEATCQRPSAKSCSGTSDRRVGTLKNRIFGNPRRRLPFPCPARRCRLSTPCSTARKRSRHHRTGCRPPRRHPRRWRLRAGAGHRPGRAAVRPANFHPPPRWFPPPPRQAAPPRSRRVFPTVYRHGGVPLHHHVVGEQPVEMRLPGGRGCHVASGAARP